MLHPRIRDELVTRCRVGELRGGRPLTPSPAPAGLARMSGEGDAAVAPEQGRPRVGAGRRPGEQPLQGRPDQGGRWGEGDAEAAGGVVGVDQQLVAGHGREPGGVGQPVRVPAPRPGGEPSITRASTVAKVPITRISSALAVSGGTRSSIVSCRSWPAARSVAYHRVPSAMWMTACATVQSISGIGLVQSRSTAAPSSAWHSPAASSTSPPSTAPFSPTPQTAAGLTAAGRRIVGSCPVQEEVVVVTTIRP